MNSREAIKTLLSTPWFIAAVAGCEITMFAIGLIVGLKIGH